jgi:hypothetical protein
MNSADLLSLSPARYLAGGFRDAEGAPRPELTGLWALAAMQQLRAAGVTAKVFEGGVTALKPVLLAQASSSLSAPEPLALRAALAEHPKAVRALLGALIDGAQSVADLRPLLAHVGQVLSLLALAEATPPALA